MADGETMVVVGYSGSGKSVALKHVVGLLEPDAGAVEVDGQEGGQPHYPLLMSAE